MNRKKTWTIAAISLTVVVVGAVAYRVIDSNDSSGESPDTVGQPEEERQLEIQESPVSTTSTTLPEEQEPVVEEEPEEEVTEDPETGTEVDDSEEDPPTTTVSTTSTTLPEEQEPVVEEEPEEEVTEDPETGTEVDDSTEDPTVTTPVSTTSTTLPEEQEPVVEEEPEEEVTEDPETGTEVDDSTEDPTVTTPVSTTSTTLPEEQEPVVEEEPEEEVTEDPETGTEVDDSEDWVLFIPPNPVWLEEARAIEAFYDNCCQNSKDEETLKQMFDQFIGDNCDAGLNGICKGMTSGQMLSMYSRRACPRGWSLTNSPWFDPQYDYNMCSHPDHMLYDYDRAYYPPNEADPRGVPKDYWNSNAG